MADGRVWVKTVTMTGIKLIAKLLVCKGGGGISVPGEVISVRGVISVPGRVLVYRGLLLYLGGY